MLDGMGHSITAVEKNSSNYTPLNINASNCTVELHNLGVYINQSSGYMRGINVNITENLNLVLDNVVVDICDYYAFNICEPNTGLKVTINNSSISGWAAVYNHASGVEFTANNSTFTGFNPHNSPDSSSNHFSTILISEYILPNNDDEFVEENLSANNTFTFNNCSIVSHLGTDENGDPLLTRQYSFDIRSPYHNELYLNGCTIVRADENDVLVRSAYDSAYIPEENRDDLNFVVNTNKVIIDGEDCTNDEALVSKYFDD